MAKKNKKNKEVKPQNVIDQEAINAAPPIRKAGLIRNMVKKEGVENGDYFCETPAGPLTIRKSGTTGMITLFLNDERVTQSALSKAIREASATPPTKDTQSGKEITNGKLQKEYKKKQLINILQDKAIFRKKVIKKIKSEITDKSLSGSVFLAVIDDVTGKEVSYGKIEKIFSDL